MPPKSGVRNEHGPHLAARAALAQTAAKPTLRFGTIYVPHGVIMDVWMPKRTGTDFELTEQLAYVREWGGKLVFPIPELEIV